MRCSSMVPLCLAAMAVLCPSLPAQTVTPPSLSSPQLESLADSLVLERMERDHVPGLVVVVVRNGRTLLAKGYGKADLGRAIPMTPSTGLRAGSVSKPVSAAAVMLFVQEGKLTLDAPIDRYLPALPPDRFGRASTVAQLLTMTGGYSDDVLEVHVPEGARCPSLGEFLDSRKPVREIEPGVMSYSSWNLALLGRAMERIDGEPFDRIMQRRLLGPLGMTRSTFAQPPPPALGYPEGNLASGYFHTGGRFTIVPYDLVPLSPGIGLVTTGEDMGRFMAALLSPPNPSLFTAASRVGLLHRQAAMHPFLRGRSFGFSETSFGPPGTLYHDGNGIGFGSRMILVPQQGIGIFVAANHRALDRALEGTPAFGAVREVAVKLLEGLAPGEPIRRPVMKPLSGAVGRAKEYAGQYQAAAMPRHNFMKVGMLFDVAEVRANGDGTLSIGSSRYAEVDRGLFQNAKWTDTLAAFRRDRRGEVRYLTFGGTGTYERVPWYGRLGLHILLDAVVAACSFGLVIVSLVRRTGRSILVLLSALANLAFIAGFAAYMKGSDLLMLFKSFPLPLKAVLLLPWLGVAMLVLAVGRRYTIRPERSGSDSWTFALAAAAAVLLIAQLLYWRLLPW